VYPRPHPDLILKRGLKKSEWRGRNGKPTAAAFECRARDKHRGAPAETGISLSRDVVDLLPHTRKWGTASISVRSIRWCGFDVEQTSDIHYKITGVPMHHLEGGDPVEIQRSSTALADVASLDPDLGRFD